MSNPFRGRGPFRQRGPFRGHGPFRGLGPFGRPDASRWQTSWHFAQDTYDADPAPVGIKTLVTSAVASALGITNAQGGSVGMTVMSQTGVLTTLAVGAIPITYERGATRNWIKDCADLSTANWTKRGTATAAAGVARSNGVVMSLITVGAIATNDIYQTVTGYPASTRVEPALWLERVSTSGTLKFRDPYNVTPSEWNIDLSLVPDGPQYITRAHRAVSIVTEFTSAAGGQCGAWFGMASGSGSVYVAVVQAPGTTPPVYLRTFGTAPLYTAGTPRSQNLATGSGTQTITGLVSGCAYTVLHQTGGTYTLSGATTGTTTAGTATRFVASSTSLTLTASSTPTLLQVYEGTADLAYVAGPYSEYPQAGRYDDAVGATNSIGNSSMTGAAAGSPGTMPTGWSGTFTGSGLTQSIAATGTYLGAPYIDIRIQGTSPASQIYPQISHGAAVAASATQQWTQSCYIGIVAGSLNGISNFFIAPADNNAGQTAKYFQPVAYVDRYWATHTVVAGGTTIMSILGLVTTGSSTAVDITIRIMAPQFEQRSVATPWVPTTNAAATRSPTLIRYPNSYLTDGPQTVASCVVPAKAATGANQCVLGRSGGYVAYLGTAGDVRVSDGTSVLLATGAPADGVPATIAVRWGGSTKSVSVNGGAIQSNSFDGTMGSGTVGSGDGGNGSDGFTGLRKWDKSAPRAFNDTDFARASAGII